MNTPASPQFITYQLNANGVHEWLWNATHNRAVDQWVESLEALWTITPSNGTSLHIHRIMTSQLPSVAYLGTKTRELEVKFPNRPPVRTAMIAKNRIWKFTLNTIITLMTNHSKDKTRFFLAEEEASAMQWLLQEAHT